MKLRLVKFEYNRKGFPNDFKVMFNLDQISSLQEMPDGKSTAIHVYANTYYIPLSLEKTIEYIDNNWKYYFQ